jgi:hypothetical protein
MQVCSSAGYSGPDPLHLRPKPKAKATTKSDMVTFNINGFMVVCYNLFLRTEEYVLKICLI